jgi:histone acetyltransferase (RNA polymerase elongator complex component)
MPGLPGDTPEESVRSAETAASLGPYAVRIYPTVVLRGTRLAEMYESASYSPLTLESAVDLCAKLLSIFQARSIPVIRMGLHPFSPGEEKNILGGPYHPAFGFLVKSRLRRNEMEERIDDYLATGTDRSDGRITLEVPFRIKEECFGQLRENTDYLKAKYPGLTIEYVVTEREDLGIRI